MVEAATQRRSSLELVGRRDELGALEDELSRTVAGEFRVVLLLGEAGVGKSRLGRELLARHREVTGLVARAYPLAASAAFGLWTEAVDPFLRTRSDSEVVELCGGLLDDLASVFHRVALVRGAVPGRDPPLPRLLQGLAGLREGEAAQRRAATIARQDEKAYRLTVVLGGLAIALALQGRVGETAALFDEAKAANPAFRDSILVELEAVVRWIAGDFAAALGLAREAVAWHPAATPRRRAIGPVFGALAAIEPEDLVEAERLLARAQAVYGGRDWSFFLPITRWAEGVLAWHAGGAAEGVAVLRPAAARLSDMQARTWAAFVLLDLAEAAADAGDVAAATAARPQKAIDSAKGLAHE